MKETHTNTAKTTDVESTWRRLLDAALQRGFYGSLAVEVTIQDGTIQKICERTERVRK